MEDNHINEILTKLEKISLSDWIYSNLVYKNKYRPYSGENIKSKCSYSVKFGESFTRAILEDTRDLEIYNYRTGESIKMKNNARLISLYGRLELDRIISEGKNELSS